MQTQQQQKSIDQIYQDSLQLSYVADSYCKSRGLANRGFGYLKFLQHNNRIISEVIVIPVRDAVGKLVMLELRSIKFKEHIKLVKDSSYHIYNIENAIKNPSYVILTEGVWDAEALIQRGYNAVATLSASIPATAKHAMTIFNNIIIAYDNDGAGVRSARDLFKFYRESYKDTGVDVLEYSEKDINEALVQGNINEVTSGIDQILDAIDVTA